MTTFEYNKNETFTNGLRVGILVNEIKAEFAVPIIISITNFENLFSFTFASELTDQQIVKLNNVIAIHNLAVNNTEPQYIKYISNNTISSTNSTAYQTKSTLITDFIKKAVYKISWQYNYKSSITACVLLDDVLIFEQTNSDTGKLISGFIYKSLPANIHNIQLLYKANTSSTTVSIWDTRLEITYVSDN